MVHAKPCKVVDAAESAESEELLTDAPPWCYSAEGEWKACSAVAIPYATHPKDQTSDFNVYGWFWHTSGLR